MAPRPSTDTNNVEEQETEEEPPEDYSPEEEAMDLVALAQVVCYRCNKKGRFARSCKLPAKGKGGKSGGKGGARFMQSYGKGGAGAPCPVCHKPGHKADACWKLHPELTPAKFQKKGKVQQAEEEENGEIQQLGMINLCVVELKETSSPELVFPKR